MLWQVASPLNYANRSSMKGHGREQDCRASERSVTAVAVVSAAMCGRDLNKERKNIYIYIYVTVFEEERLRKKGLEKEERSCNCGEEERKEVRKVETGKISRGRQGF